MLLFSSGMQCWGGGGHIIDREREGEWMVVSNPSTELQASVGDECSVPVSVGETFWGCMCLQCMHSVLAECYRGHPCETLVAFCISALCCSSHLLWISFQSLRLCAGLSVLRCSISPHQQAALGQTPGCAKMGFTPIKSPLECALNGMIQCAAFVRGCLNIIVVGGMKFGGPAGPWRSFSSCLFPILGMQSLINPLVRNR